MVGVVLGRPGEVPPARESRAGSLSRSSRTIRSAVFFSKAFEFGEGRGIACGDSVADRLGGGASENGQGGFGANAGNMMEKQSKEISFS